MRLGLLLRVHWPMVDNSEENYFLLHPLLYCCETAAAEVIKGRSQTRNLHYRVGLFGVEFFLAL